MSDKPKRLALTEIDGAISYISFNRPDFLNAFNLDLAEGFINTLAEFERKGNPTCSQVGFQVDRESYHLTPWKCCIIL